MLNIIDTRLRKRMVSYYAAPQTIAEGVYISEVQSHSRKNDMIVWYDMI